MNLADFFSNIKTRGIQIIKRIGIYKKTTEPVKDYYESIGLLSSINGEGTVEEVSRRMEAALK